jgi:hypothetical protein
MSRYPTPGGIAVFLPDYRARFKGVLIGESWIRASFETGTLPIAGCMIRSVVDNQDASDRLEFKPDEGSARLEVSEAKNSVELYLLDRDADNIIDWVQLRSQASETYPEIEFANPGSQIQRLIRQGEGKTQEFKQEVGDGDRLVQSVVAFANSGGGTIFVGVDDDGQSHSIDSRASADRIERAIRMDCDPYIQVQFEPATIDEKQILLVRVPEGQQKPYVFRKRGTIHVRGGRTNFLATSEEVRRLVGGPQ